MTTHSDPQESGAASICPDRFVRLPEALNIVSLGRSCWLELVKTKNAPAPIKIGRASVWVEAEVRQFVRERIAQSRAASK